MWQELDLGVCSARYWARDDKRVVVVLPGAGYLPGYPLLWFARKAAVSCDWSVLELWYEWTPTEGDPARFVEARLEAALARVTNADQILLVGKSLGSLAASAAARANFPAIWITPLLRNHQVVEAIIRTTGRRLLVGGTADEAWASDAIVKAREGDAVVVEISGGDHALEISDDLPATLAALTTVTQSIAAFIAEL